jgi:hypothetical protein
MMIGLTAAFISGCEQQATSVMEEVPPEQGHIYAVGMSYLTYQNKNEDKTPKSIDDLKPFLKQFGDPDKLLISPRDNKPYVILFNLPSSLQGQYVIAYEQEGKDGKRFMVQTDGRFWEVTPEELKKLRFPPGYKLNLSP